MPPSISSVEFTLEMKKNNSKCEQLKPEKKTTKPTVLMALLVCVLGSSIYGGYETGKCAYIWNIARVDSIAMVHLYTSIALDRNNNPHISYFEYGAEDLKYAYYDGSWHIETVDSEGWVGWYNCIAVDSNGNPHISYFDRSNGDLKYAYRDSIWNKQTVQSEGYTGFYTSIALDRDGNPHISFAASGDLRYAHFDDSWQIETADAEGYVGTYNSIVVDSHDNPHISYWDEVNKDLKYAYYDGVWHTETVDAEGYVGQHTSIVLDSHNSPHIAYYDHTNRRAKYAWYDGTWHTEEVYGAGWAMHTSISLDSSDNPHVSSYNYYYKSLWYAYRDGMWHDQQVDSVGDVGRNTSLALDSKDMPHISYVDFTHTDLMYARGTPAYTLTITATSGGISNPSTGIHLYPKETTATVEAIADSCHVFDHWEVDGSNVGSVNPYTILMDNDHALHAVFLQIEYDLAITAGADGTTNPDPGVYAYGCGSSIRVRAIPNLCYLLDHWELDGLNLGSPNPCTVFMNDDHGLRAEFRAGIYDLATTQVSPSETLVSKGCVTSIDVTVENLGDCPETFNLLIYHNATLFWRKTIVDLPPSEDTTITLNWNWIWAQPGSNTISGYVQPVTCETDTINNTLVDGVVMVVLCGDSNGDGDVDIVDVVCLVDYLFRSGTEPVPAACAGDVNADGSVDIVDAVYLVNYVLYYGPAPLCCCGG